MTIKRFFFLHFLLALLFTFGVYVPANAQTQSTPYVDRYNNIDTSDNTDTLADIKTGVISRLKQDGYLSDKMALEAAKKYITPKDAQTRVVLDTGNTSSGSNNSGNSQASNTHSVNTGQQTTSNTNTNNFTSSPAQVATPSLAADVSWTRFLSWTNFFKTFGVVLLLVALSGFIKKIIKSLWHLIVAVPAIVYQSVFLVAFLFGLIYPEKVWASQYFYVALFCAFGTLMILGWIISTYPQIQAIVKKLFDFGIPVATVASFWLMMYFGTLALVYQSQIFGFFAAIALSGIFSFTLMYMPGVLFLSFKENALPALVWGHIAVLVGYVMFHYSGLAPAQLAYFSAGIEYYCATALGVGLLVGASPWYRNREGQRTAPMYALLFIAVFVAASAVYFLGFTTMATIVMCFFALFFLEWMGYVGFKTHWIAGCALVGALVFGLGLTMESYAPIILQNLKSVL